MFVFFIISIYSFIERRSLFGISVTCVLFSLLLSQAWDFIFLKGNYPDGCSIPEEKLLKCRNEFEFWYPMDLRVSGKDLVRNHLTMCLYNHAAIWEGQPEKWPRSFFTNGHVMVDNQKMSKSSGNFISLSNAIQGKVLFNIILKFFN